MSTFLAALQFLTTIRLRRSAVNPEKLGQSTVYFPVVGLMIGLVMAGLSWLLNLALPSSVVNVLLLVYLVVITGGLHLDGFMDTCDGLAGRSVEERLRIMDDSRVGGFAVAGAFCLLLLKYVALNSLPKPAMPAALVLMTVISRWAMVYAISVYPYAKPEGLGTAFRQAGARWRLLTATLVTLLIVFGIAFLNNSARSYAAGLTVIFVAWLVTVVVASFLKGRLSGLTGDSYGAINEAVEVSVLLAIIFLARLPLL